MRTLIGFILLCWIGEFEAMEVKMDTTCQKDGYTFIDANHAVTNCGDTLKINHYKP